MADYFVDRYFPSRYFPGSYFEGGEQNPGAMSAGLSGAGAAGGDIIAAPAAVSARPATGSGGSGSRWWEEARYQRKARQWTEAELDDLVEAAFAESGVAWGRPITPALRRQIRKRIEARSHALNVLLPAPTDVTMAIDRREVVNARLRTDDEDDTLLLLAA